MRVKKFSPHEISLERRNLPKLLRISGSPLRAMYKPHEMPLVAKGAQVYVRADEQTNPCSGSLVTGES